MTAPAARPARPVPGGPPPAPVAQHVLVTYTKRGRMRFASHRDVGRVFERAVRRAGVPVAHSAGFSPHPKISYASGTPTGVASQAEYLTLALTSTQDPERLRQALDAALPAGIDVVDVRADPGGSLSSRLTASEWLVELPGVPPDTAETAVRAFLAAPEVPVERLTNKGRRRLDARAAVLAMELDRRACRAYPDGHGTLRMAVRHTQPAVRPEDVLTALRQIAGLVPASPPVVTRLAQGEIGDDGMVRPAAGLTAGPGPAPAHQAGEAGHVAQVGTTMTCAGPADEKNVP